MKWIQTTLLKKDPRIMSSLICYRFRFSFTIWSTLEAKVLNGWPVVPQSNGYILYTTLFAAYLCVILLVMEF